MASKKRKVCAEPGCTRGLRTHPYLCWEHRGKKKTGHRQVSNAAGSNRDVAALAAQMESAQADDENDKGQGIKDWQNLDWQDLTDDERNQARSRHEPDYVTGRMCESRESSILHETDGDLLTADDLLPYLARMWQNAGEKGEGGFTLIPHKNADGEVAAYEGVEGIAAAVQYTELDLTDLSSLDEVGADLSIEMIEAMEDWQIRLREAMEEPNATIGCYFNKEKGILEINITTIFTPEHKAEAIYFCEDGNQYSAWDFSANDGDGGEILTGGTGKHPKPPDGW